MPSIWIILAAVVGAVNVRFMIPVVAAFLGVGKRSDAPERDPHLIA